MLYVTFATKVVRPQDGPAYFEVPQEVRKRLGMDDLALPVCGEIAGLPYRGIAWKDEDKRSWFVELSPELLGSGRFADGRTVEATIAYDDEPREATIPYELTETLGMAPLAERAWDKLTEEERQPYCEWVAMGSDPKQRWTRAQRAALMIRRGRQLEHHAHAA